MQYNTNRFQATDIRPQQRRWFNDEPPYWQESLLVGVEGNRHTVIKVYCRKPNLQYPTAKIFISFSNGRQSTFSRLSTPNELETISKWLKLLVPTARTKIDELEPLAEAARKQQDDFANAERISEQLRAAQEFMSPEEEIE